jgi:predicted DNA-binding transcriptional regulator AlpA
MERRGYPRVLAAEYIGISPSKFSQLVREKKIPEPREIDGGKLVWDRYDLDEYFDAQPRRGDPGDASEWDDLANGQA